MGIKIGSDKIGSIFVDGNKIGKVFVGSDCVYTSVTHVPVTMAVLSYLGDATATICLNINGSWTPPTVQYNLNNAGWTNYTFGTPITITKTSAGTDKLCWRGLSNTFSVSSSNYLQFSMTLDGGLCIAACGEITSLINYSSVLPDYCFFKLFNDCSCLGSGPAFKEVTSVGENACEDIFAGCSKLFELDDTLTTRYMILPATTLGQYCYYGMFNGCTSLTTAPALPAITAYGGGYMYMFQGCTSLTTAPELPATTLSTQSYYGMFSGCTSLQVSDTQTTAAPYAWRIPRSETFTKTASQSNMFRNCAGTRSSDNMAGAAGNAYTYYTQNTPIVSNTNEEEIVELQE